MTHDAGGNEGPSDPGQSNIPPSQPGWGEPAPGAAPPPSNQPPPNQPPPNQPPQGNPSPWGTPAESVQQPPPASSPPPYGAPPGGYGNPPPGSYGAPVSGQPVPSGPIPAYAPPPAYGTPPPAYGAPPGGYGAPPPAYGVAPGYGPPGAYGQFGGPTTSGLAVAGMICSIAGLFLCGLPAVVGLILSIIARSQINKSNGTLKGAGMALAGIIVGAVAIVLYIAFWSWAVSRTHSCGNGQYSTAC